MSIKIMSLRAYQLVLTLVLMVSITSSLAKTHVVTVRDNSFKPRNISITVGDTVRWINEGPDEHNVYAASKFRCANGCEADGGDGTPSSDEWVAEVTFRVPESVNYVCQPHANSGMNGTVTVNPPSSDVAIIEAQPNNTFNPNDLTITAGDLVYFSNQGGEHNFRAIDDSLICAEGCIGDGMNVTTSPTGFDWKFYARFNQPGDIPYYCANPAHPNQDGILRVLSDVFFRNGFEPQ